MDAGDSTIPIDLVYRILGFLPLKDLLRTMPVCQLWRTVAQDLPVYWRDIQLLRQEPSPSLLSLTETRICYARLRGITVDIRLPDPAPLLPVVTTHLHHIADLQLHADDLHAALQVSATLCAAAPLLKNLWLEYYPWKNNLPGWPTINAEFLRGCPSLERLIAHNFLLPDDSALPVLSSLKFLSLRCSDSAGDAVAIPDLFRSCPKLKHLHLEGHIILGPSYGYESSWRNIEGLFLGGSCAERYPTLPISHVRHVDLDGRATFSGAQQILSHIPTGPPFFAFLVLMEMSPFLHVPRQYAVRARFSAGDNRIVREIDTVVAKEVVPGPDTVFRLILDVASRAGTVLFSNTGWNAFAAFCPELPTVERVVIVLDESCTQLEASLVAATIMCPRVRILELCRQGLYLDPWRVAPADLVHFARAALGDASSLELCLSGIVLDGRLEDLAPTFRSVSYKHRKISYLLHAF